VAKPEELLAVIPDDLVTMAEACQLLSGDPRWETTFKAPLLDETSRLIASLTAGNTPLAGGIDGMLAVAWVSKILSDQSTRVRALQIALGHAPLRSEVRYQLALALWDSGQQQQAIREAEAAFKRTPATEAQKQLVDAWRKTLDQKK